MSALRMMRVAVHVLLKVPMRFVCLSALAATVSVALIHPAAVVAQPSSLTLQDAIALAQRHGPAAQVARSTRDNARDLNDEFNRKLLPQFFLTGNAIGFDHAINPITEPDGSLQYVGQAQNQTSLQAGFSQQIPWTGSVVSVSSGVSRIDLLGDPYQRTYSTSPVFVTLQQDLFKPRTFLWNERVQSLTAVVAERGYLEAREDVASTTAGAFFDLYTQQVTLANAQANVAVNDTLYTLNEDRFKVGKISENDLLKSELALLNARAAAADAQLARDKAEAVLRDLMEYPANQPLTIVTPDSIPLVGADPTVAVAQALRNSSSMHQNALDNVSAQQGLETARSDDRFTATISASAGFNQSAARLGQAYQNPLGSQSLTIGVNVPILQWGAGHAEVEAAKANAVRVTANNTMRRDALVEDARFSALQLQQARRNVGLAAKADTVAAKEFDVARNRYIVNKISNTDLYSAQQEKDAAVVAYMQALRTYWTVYYHLRRVTLYDFVAQQPLSDERSVAR